MKKICALLLAVLLVVSVFAGCAGNQGNGQSNGNKPGTSNGGNAVPVDQVNSEFYPMTGIDTVFDVIYSGRDVAEGRAYDLLTKAIGLNINPLEYTEEQYQMVMRSGNLPDACYRNFGFDKTQIFEMGEAGKLVDLSQYFHIMPNFVAFLDKYPNARYACTNEDGSIYCFPSVIDTAGSSSNLIYVRTDMAEAAGWTTMPTTVEELVQMSLDIQELYSDVDKFYAVTWTAGEWLQLDGVVTQTLLPSFGELLSAEFTANAKGEVVLGAASEQYKTYLKYMHEWYNSGAVWKEVYADDGTMSRAKLAANECAIAFGQMSGITKENFASETFEVLCLDPLTSSVYNVKQYAKVAPGNIDVNAWISTSCKDIEAMCRWFDAFFAPEDNCLDKEGTIWSVSAWLGQKGVDFVVEVETEYGKGYTQPNGSPAGAMGYPFMGSTTYYSVADSLFGIKCDAMINQLLPYRKTIPLVMDLPVDSDDQEELDNIWVDMQKYINESTAKFITGQWDVDTGWQSYINTLESMGMSDVCELLQPYYTDSIS